MQLSLRINVEQDRNLAIRYISNHTIPGVPHAHDRHLRRSLVNWTTKAGRKYYTYCVRSRFW